MLIIIFGLPGSGKSFFAGKLADRLQAEYLSSDLIRKSFPKKDYSPEGKARVYEKMKMLMLENIRQGKNVVIDATFHLSKNRKIITDACKKQDITYQFIEIRADEEIIKERVSKKREHSDADYSVYLKTKDEFEPLTEEHLIQESRQDNIEEMLHEAITYINPSARL